MGPVPPRLRLAALPTPLLRLDRLTEQWGGPTIWVKRDDLTGFGLSGNKVRKLEFHLAAAASNGADTVITCGAVQSNHCRATAVAAARLGLACVVFLRTANGMPPPRVEGNHLVAALVGADVRFVDADWYIGRDREMAAVADSVSALGGRAWVIPEGASDGLGLWGYLSAAEEVRLQLVREGLTSVVLWHAASSGGTTAGLAAHQGLAELTSRLVAISVSDPAPTLAARISKIWDEAFGVGTCYHRMAGIEIRDDFLAAGYGLATAEELRVQAEASALTGLIFDPTYTGKAIYALHREISAGAIDPAANIVFWHTGGGFAAFAHDFGSA